MAAAVRESCTVTDFGSDATTHNANMPATVNSGDLLLAIVSFDTSSTTITTPSGWTRIIGMTVGAICITAVYAKVADGTEDGTTVDFATNNAQRGSVHTYRFSGWAGNLAPGVRATMGGVNTTSALVALGVGSSLDVHWVAFQAKSSSTAWGGTPPSGYTNETKSNVSEDNVSSASIASATRTNTAVFEDVPVLWNIVANFQSGLIAVLPA